MCLRTFFFFCDLWLFSFFHIHLSIYLFPVCYQDEVGDSRRLWQSEWVGGPLCQTTHPRFQPWTWQTLYPGTAHWYVFYSVNQGCDFSPLHAKSFSGNLDLHFCYFFIWVRSQKCVCLVTWFCYQLIVKPGNKTAAPPWPDPYWDDASSWKQTSPWKTGTFLSLHVQYCSCWSLGDAGRQGISKFDIDIVLTEYFGISTRRIKTYL